MGTSWLEEWLENSERSIKRMQRRIKGRKKGSDATVELYAIGVRDYLGFLNLESPDNAIQLMQEKEIDPTTTIDEWIDVLLERVSSGTARKYIGGVKRWLQVSKIPVKWNDIEMPVYESEEEDRAPTTDDLHTILNYTYQLRDKAAIFCALSSGLRIGTLLTLTFGDCDFDYFDDVVVVVVKPKPGRKIRGKKAFITFFGPEAREALLTYKLEREKQGEKITAETYLFPATTNKTKPISTDTFRVQWIRILERSGLAQKSEGGKWHELHFHVLRKWFETKCKIAGVKASFYQHWMTHKGGKDPETYLDRSYFKPILEEHVVEYRKAIPHLTLKTVSESTIKTLQKSVKELERENLELKHRLNGQTPEVQRLKEEVNELRQHFEDVRDYNTMMFQKYGAEIVEKEDAKIIFFRRPDMKELSILRTKGLKEWREKQREKPK